MSVFAVLARRLHPLAMPGAWALQEWQINRR